MSDSELEDELHRRIVALTKEGDSLFAKKKYADALARYIDAWQLVPAPKTNWNASTWILAAIGDSYYLLKRYAEARTALEHAMRCPKAIGNPFLHLRLGEVYLEMGEEKLAADNLTRAYALEGDKIFSKENEKYLAFLRTKADLGPVAKA